MTDIEVILDELEESGIDIFNIGLKKLKAASVCDEDGDCSISIDEAKLNTSAERKTALLHEQGHCETHTFYNTLTPFERVERLEYRADKYVAENKITKYMIVRAARNEGFVDVWEFAEYFGVTVEYMKRLMWIHFQMEFME